MPCKQAWQFALQNGGQEIELRRNLAILLATQGRGNAIDLELAIEHAEIASQMSGENEWSVELARSTAHFAMQDRELAKQLAEKAGELAHGECLDFCMEILDGFKEGILKEWDFRAH